jgi:PAS domain S-box-containing protein
VIWKSEKEDLQLFVPLGEVAVDSQSSDFLHQNPDWFRVTLASIGDAVIATDVNGRVTFLNSVAERLTGWTQAQSAGHPLIEVFNIINEYSRKPAPNPVARVLREGIVVGLANHTLLISRDGIEYPIEDSAAPILDEQKKIIGVVLVFHDVTEQKKTETALAESERRFRLMVDSVKDYAIYMLDPLGNVSSWNSGAERMKGYRPDEIIGAHFSRFFLPEDVQAGKPERELKAAIQDGRFEIEDWRLRKDGSRFWANVVLTAVRDESARLLGFAKVTRDITSRKIALEKLRESEERFRLLMESVKDYAIFMVDTVGNIVSWNAGAQRIKGYSADEIIGKSLSTFYLPEEVMAGKVERELKIAADIGRYEEEGIRVRKDGSKFYASIVISPMRDASNKLIGFAKVTRDITERKHAEQKLHDANVSLDRRVKERTAELEKANAMLEEQRAQLQLAARMKDEFLLTLSHELRTPLMPMLGWARILKDKHLDPQTASRGIQVIEKSIVLQVKIIEDLLDISRIVSGNLKLDLKPVGLAQVVEAAIDVVRGAAEAKSIHIEFKMPGSVGPVMGDATRLQQVAWNLLSNAVKFTPKGGQITLELRRSESRAVLKVTDTGEGIAPEYLATLFQRFSQADSGTTRRFGGLGIGLSIAKHLVELHGGSISGESAGPGKGSTFTVSLPLSSAPIVLNQYPLGEVPKMQDRLEGVRVHVVDDEELGRDFLVVILSQFGAIVHAAGSVREAMKLLDDFDPDVVVTDIGMPDQDGYDFINYLRSTGKNTPAIALTAFARAEDRNRALSQGFQAHLAKPVEPADLISTVAGLASK